MASENQAPEGADITDITAESVTESMSATEQLSALLEAGEPAPADESIELAADNDSAPIDWWVVAPAMVVVAGIVVWGLASKSTFKAFADTALAFIVENFGWAFILCGTVAVFFVVVVAMSNFGRIRLGADGEEPEFRTSSWIAMMFAAGMGIGLMFYGASEPLTFYREGVPGHDEHDVGTAMATAMFHWTLHPWAIYAIVGMAIAYSTFRVGRKQLISSTFVPLIGERRASGPLGRFIDILAVIATIFGTACSLGIGATQVSAGLQASGIIENPGTLTVTTIVVILTLAFIVSAMSGVSRGIQYLSNTNRVLAALLAIFVFVLGPTVAILDLIPSSIGSYLNSFFEMAGRSAISADGTAGSWLSTWTIFYWAWWISWSPFVGMFLARISRGRTIRQFCIGVMFVPAGLSTVWFAIFGGTAIHFEQSGNSIWGDGNAESQLFALLHQMPGGTIAGYVAMLLLATFFITSADSASTVMGSMSQNGLATAKPTLSAAWGALTALIGLMLLLSGESSTDRSALSNLQNVTIIAASPFLVIVIVLMFALVKGLRNDTIYMEYREHQRFARKLAHERRLHREEMERKIRARRYRAAVAAMTPRREHGPRGEQKHREQKRGHDSTARQTDG